MELLEFDGKNFGFKSATRSVWRPLRKVLWFLLSTISVSVVLYAVASPFVRTPEERRMKKHIDSLEHTYAVLMAEDEIIEDVITGLQVKDARIYDALFHSEAPNVDPVGQLSFLFGSDTIPDTKLVSYTTRKAGELEARVVNVEAAFCRIFDAIAEKDFVAPPMRLPLKNINYIQVGAGTGEKMNPFYKARVYHRGLDVIVPRGTSVYAPADGEVYEASRSSKGQGNVVRLNHGGGYRTGYAHLSEIAVTKGQKVRRGQRIGAVGMSGTASAPHLHYEVMKDTLYVDPVNYFFAAVAPDLYANMLFMSANTLQSLD